MENSIGEPRFYALMYFPHEWRENGYKISIQNKISFRKALVKTIKSGKHKGSFIVRFVPKKTNIFYEWGTNQPQRPLFSTMIVDTHVPSLTVFNIYQYWVYLPKTAKTNAKLYENIRVLIFNSQTTNPIGYCKSLDHVMTIYKKLYHKYMPNMIIEIPIEDQETLCQHINCVKVTENMKKRSTIPAIIPLPEKQKLEQIEQQGLQEIEGTEQAEKLYEKIVTLFTRKTEATAHERKSRVKVRNNPAFIL